MQVIILAQGQQTRMGDPRTVGYKHLLKLPECNNCPIIVRTYRQLIARSEEFKVVVVSWPEVHIEIAGSPLIADPFIMYREDFITLPDPGNSSLRGIKRVLDARGGDEREATIVLLGDVVYSWACLDALFKMVKVSGFVGTSDLSNDGGELWGVAWPAHMGGYMTTDLEDALDNHPPSNDVYQCGQLRRWVSGFRRGDLREHVRYHMVAGTYIPIDDYTRDIDTKEQLALLPALSAAAAADDRENGLVWQPTGWVHE